MTTLCKSTVVRSLFAALVIGCLFSFSGCDDLAGSAMETAVKRAAKKDPKRAKFANSLQAIQDECPKQINEYTTLQYVKMKGLNRIEFRYLVSESGRRFVNLNNRWELYEEIEQRTLNTPIADSVIAMDLSVDHIFRDADDKQMFSHSVYKNDLKKRKVKNKIAELREAKAKKQATANPAPAEETVSNVNVEESGESSDSSETPPGVTPVKNSAPAKLTITTLQAGPKQTGNLDVGKNWLPTAGMDPRSVENPAGLRNNPFAQ